MPSAYWDFDGPREADTSMSPGIIMGLIVALLSGVATFGGTRIYYTAQLNALRLERAQVDAARSKAFSDELQRRDAEHAKMQLKATELGQAIAEHEAHAQITKMERDDAVKRYTKGRACLAADALRVLNATSSGAGVPAVQTPSGGQQDAGTPSAGATLARAGEQPEPGATDNDVALWISDARSRYAGCAKRLTTWQDWYAYQ